jgi:hypothetical protein
VRAAFIFAIPVSSLGVIVALASFAGCVNRRFRAQGTPPALDPPAEAVLARIGDARRAKGHGAPVIVPELQDVARRGAAEVARGEWTLKTAAHQSALRAVSQVGRHVYSFATACADPAAFGPPALATDLEPLALGVAVAPMAGGAIVLLVVAEPGGSSIQADRLNGGGGGTLPTFERYAHPAASIKPCGAEWPVTARGLW